MFINSIVPRRRIDVLQVLSMMTSNLDWKMVPSMSDSGTAVVVSCYASSGGLGGGMEQTQTLARPSQHRSIEYDALFHQTPIVWARAAMV